MRLVLHLLTTLIVICSPLLSLVVEANERPNVLFIAIDDLRNDLGVLGVEHARTPQIDSFARTARIFDHHFVQVPTCGASRCALLRGRYPNRPAHLGNNAIRETQDQWVEQSLPMVFRRHGYQTLAIGKISHYPGGRTGKNWAEGLEELPGAWHRHWVPTGPWKTPQAVMHGYAQGVARDPGKSPPWEAFDGPDEAYPDAWVAAEAVSTLEQLVDQTEPWFLAVGFFKPHLPFAAPKRWHELHAAGVPDLPAKSAARRDWPSGWHGSGEFRGNYRHEAGRDPATDPEYARLLRRAYAGSISYVDAQVGRVLDSLHELELEKNTIVVLWSDHGFLLGEHAIWGKHCLYEHALRSPLMIRYPGLPQPGQVSSAIVETVDLFPTLVELCEISAPTELDGQSLIAQLKDSQAPAHKPAFGFWNRNQQTIRTDRWRLIRQQGRADQNPRDELFDMHEDPLELDNVAARHLDVVEQLARQLPGLGSE